MTFNEYEIELNKIREEKIKINSENYPKMTLEERDVILRIKEEKLWQLKTERAKSIIGKCFKYTEAGYLEFIIIEKVEKRNKEEDSSEIFGMINFGERAYIGAFLNVTDHGIYDIPIAIRRGVEISQEEFISELKKFKTKISQLEQRVEEIIEGGNN